jgi:hypothetical protein
MMFGMPFNQRFEWLIHVRHIAEFDDVMVYKKQIPQERVILKNYTYMSIVAQLVKMYRVLNGNQMFLTTLTKACHMTMSPSSLTQVTPTFHTF